MREFWCRLWENFGVDCRELWYGLWGDFVVGFGVDCGGGFGVGCGVNFGVGCERFLT